jgi:hypothetical protein
MAVPWILCFPLTAQPSPGRATSAIRCSGLKSDDALVSLTNAVCWSFEINIREPRPCPTAAAPPAIRRTLHCLFTSSLIRATLVLPIVFAPYFHSQLTLPDFPDINCISSFRVYIPQHGTKNRNRVLQHVRAHRPARSGREEGH